MSSNTRQQLEKWLSTLEISGSVLDVGGIAMPIKGRTKTWDVDKYEILDIKKELKGVMADFVWDMNKKCDFVPEYDNVFCIEVLSHIYNPMQATANLYKFLKPGGRLFLSVHFLFPRHQGTDYLRYTALGISTLMNKANLTIVSVLAKHAANQEALNLFLAGESKINMAEEEIGYLVEAIK